MKLEYFFKYKKNIVLYGRAKLKKRNISIKKENVHDRLFNDSILKKKMLENLLNKYSIVEEEKYPFIPKINEYNFCINNNYLFDITNRNLFSGRNNYTSKSFNKINCIDDYCTYNYFNRNSKKLKGNTTSSFSCTNINISDFNNLNKANKNNSIPVSTKFKNRLYKSLLKNEEADFLSRNINYNKMPVSSFNFPTSQGNLTHDFKHIIQYKNNTNDNFNLNKSKKKIRKFNSQKIIPGNNINNIIKDKKFINGISLNEELNQYKNGNDSNQNISLFNKNNNSSLFNISSIGESNKNENTKNKSSEKKERLFSFGSDLYLIDNNKTKNNKFLTSKKLTEKLNNNNNNKLSLKNDSKKNKNNEVYKRNNNKINQNINTPKRNNHKSTSYSDNNSSICNNLNHDIIKKDEKNGKEKNNKNQLEMQSTNEYYILNENNYNLKNDLIFQTTIQTLNDSEIFNLANDYMSIDNSLDSYKKKSVIYNKNHIGTNEECKIKK